MRKLLVVLGMAFGAINPASGQISVAIGFPGVSIGINLPVYPEFVRVPGYPVYYAPQVSSNYFFYDGLYWVYQGDSWYASSWYNGPWAFVAPEAVPLYVLPVPVRYYRRPPAYFHGWRADAPPRWDEYWGGSWEQSHRGWDRWDRRAMPAPFVQSWTALRWRSFTPKLISQLSKMCRPCEGLTHPCLVIKLIRHAQERTPV